MKYKEIVSKSFACTICNTKYKTEKEAEMCYDIHSTSKDIEVVRVDYISPSEFPDTLHVKNKKTNRCCYYKKDI